MSASYESRDGIAVITLDNPPVNGLGHATRLAVAAGIDRAQADPSVTAVLLVGAGKVFCGGADIREFGTPASLAEPQLGTLMRLVEGSAKPVVAVIHGVCMGGGLELALGCTYRVAAPGAGIAFPEVKLGLLPGAGGTQRLPRVLGVETALQMIVGGEPVKSEVLAALPGQRLFDRIIAGDLLTGARDFAAQVAATHATGVPLPRVRDLSVAHPGPDDYFQRARSVASAAARHFPAPLRCVDAVEASVHRSFEDGLAYERELFVSLMSTPESRALRHAFFGERAAGKIPDVPADTPLRTIARVAVVGAGTMGTGISMNFLNAGLPVVLLETTQVALDRGLATIARHYEGQVTKGKLTPERSAQRMALLTATLSYHDLGEADLVIEAVYEELGVKETVFRSLDLVAKPGAILATNTSTLNVDTIASYTKRPSDVVGLHFFSPAHVMKLLEVVRGEATAKDVLATVMAMAKVIRKLAVVSGVCDGFIGNRMIEQYVRQAGYLLDEGCTPSQVDRAIEAFGFAMGPFRMYDLAGNDIGWAIRKRRAVEHPDFRYSGTADLLCERGRFGQKTGAGWYDYRPGTRDAVPSPEVEAMITDHRASIGRPAREIDDVEIVERLVYSLVNEAARILEEGIASKASDIDMVYLTGYGFPRHRGGPLLYADSQGLANVARTMRQFARNPHDDAAFWEPAPLLARLVADGGSFT